ncbi:MAG TPA: hypothetical protein VGE22_12480 [Solimonas sp.]
MMRGLQPLQQLWKRAALRVRLGWWRWARHDQQHKDACHPDLPRIVRMVDKLERELACK